MNTNLTNSTLYELELFILSMSSPSILSLHIINFFVGLPLNFYVIILLIRAGKLDGAVIFSFCQSITEILYALPLPLYVLCHVNRRNLCFVTPAAFISGTCMTARFLFQGCLCFERYLAVVHPVTFLKNKSIKYRLACAAVMWIFSFCGIMFRNFLTLSSVASGVMYLIVLIVHLYLCFSILRVLRRPPPGGGGRKDSKVSNVKKKAFELVFFSLLIFLFQIIPLAVALGSKDKLSSEAFIVAFITMIDFNIAAGTALPVLILHQMDKLTFLGCFSRHRLNTVQSLDTD